MVLRVATRFLPILRAVEDEMAGRSAGGMLGSVGVR